MWFRLAIKDTKWEKYVETNSEYEILGAWYEFAFDYLSNNWLDEMIDEFGTKIPDLAIIEQIERPPYAWLLGCLKEEEECIVRHKRNIVEINALLGKK